MIVGLSKSERGTQGIDWGTKKKTLRPEFINLVSNDDIKADEFVP